MTTNSPFSFNNNTLQPVSSALYEKRTEFANEIRRAQRSSMIGQRRKVLYNEHLKQLSLQKQSHTEGIPYRQLIKSLQPGPHEQKLLMQLYSKLQSPNENSIRIIQEIFQQGKYCYLMDNLNQERFVKESLSIFSIILAKPNLSKTTFLVEKGFLELLLERFDKDLQNTGVISNIIGNICVDSDDFCDWIMQGHKHTVFLSAFNQLLEKFNNNKISFNPETNLKMILWMLGIIVSTEESLLDFSKQYDQILNFCKHQLNERVLVNDILSVVYELASKNSQRVEQILGNSINELLEDETGQSPHLQNLLYLVYRMTPGNFKYELVFKITFVAEYSISRLAILIIEKLEDRSAAKQIAQDEAWWQKMLIKLDHTCNQYKAALSIVRRLGISFGCVWRFVSEYLEETYQREVVMEIMIFLRNQLLDGYESYNKGIQLLENLKKVNIEKSLNRIVEKEPFAASQKAEQLLFLIHNLGKEIRQKHGIEIQ